MVEVIWTDNALKDLDEIGEYISNNSVRYAEKTVEDLFLSTEILESHPKAGFSCSRIIKYKYSSINCWKFQNSV